MKTKDRKYKNSVEGNKGSLRRSQRLKQKPASLSTAKVTKAKSKSFRKGCSKIVMRKKQHTIPSVKAKPSFSIVTEKSKKKHAPRMERKSKPKPKSHQKVANDYRKGPKDHGIPVQKEIRIFELRLIKTIQIEENYYGDVNAIRFSDVAFLDDNHILALDDNFLNCKQGHRICCVSVDGTLVCDVLVPGYPWSIVVLSPTEAVVTLRRLNSDGLIWISIDVHAKSIEITKHLPLKQEPYGLSFDGRSDLFLVSYFHHPYMSVLNRNGEEIRKIGGLTLGAHYRCLMLADNNILHLDTHKDTLTVINQEGETVMLIKHISIRHPVCLGTDCLQNMYVGNFRSGQIMKFDKCGKYRATFQCDSNLCGIGIDRKSERIVVAHDNSLVIYELDKNA
ncbi:hypothetical protein FSP39_013959 [Pinctada imbricata]|uniref:Uncharacterized protein n=1 Tax=Pinctada imbricata TaxID=66713 RepID=A0AA88XS95_PINIB|nr:hypothetical protein FSP39_013959 [Pinctada imbricata]